MRFVECFADAWLQVHVQAVPAPFHGDREGCGDGDESCDRGGRARNSGQNAGPRAGGGCSAQALTTGGFGYEKLLDERYELCNDELQKNINQ